MKRPLFVAVMLAAALVVAVPAVAQSTIYRWVDKDGKVHFSDSLPAAAKDVTQRRGAGEVETDLPFASREAARRNPVVLYVAKGCGEPCNQARELLMKRGIPYAERDPLLSTRDAESLTKLVGAMEVPVLVVGGSHQKGFESGAWQAALDGAGYPRGLPPGVRAPDPLPPVPDPARPAVAQEAQKP